MAAGLVYRSRVGRRVYYSLNERGERVLAAGCRPIVSNPFDLRLGSEIQ